MTKFALAREHRLHFEKQKLLELEGILAPQQIHQLKEKIDQAVAHSAAPQKWTKPFIAERNFNEGRDLWRKDQTIRKLVTDRGLAKIASELLGNKFLRLGYDQLLPSASFLKEDLYALPKDSPYVNLLSTPKTLEEISCIQGVLGGVCICLNSNATIDHPHQPQSSLFSKDIGNVVFFSADKEIDFPALKNFPDQDFLLIVYAAKTSLYIPNEADAHQHELKKLGFVFGDRLNDELHPVLCRA